MSKKKSFSGSTMTLKVFHGGSIPSDLPLPSAPGVSVRPPDRWGSSAIGIRPDSHHRQRPGSAGSGGGGGARLGSGFVSGGVDDRAPPFLSTPANIGRHFDEDERKPFDASAVFPRRQAPPSSSDLVVRPVPVPVRSDPKPQTQPHPRSAVGATPNAWGLRKEEVKPVVELVPPVQAVSAVNLSSRFAQASAIEKISSGRWQMKPVTPPSPSPEVISSGRWQTKPVTPPSPEVDVIRFQDTVRVVDEGRVSSLLQQEVVKERVFYNEGPWPVSNEGRFSGGPHLQRQHQQQGVGVDVGDRPKLKLLPRTKPVDANDTWTLDEKQGQPTVDHVRIENPRELRESMNMPRPGSAGADVGSRVERPRLNLKPRSLPVEKLDETTERERKSVFGSARPRELVLKERGLDDIVATNLEVTSPANRVKSDTSKADMKPKKPEPPTLATRRGERSESFPIEQRSGRDFERNDFRYDIEKVDTQRASWRNDNWKNNNREIEKPVERLLEPETWRKPVEQPKPEVPGPVPRHGKAASALELAQAFSRSVSDARADNCFPGQRGLPGGVQVPFSRLTDSRNFYPSPNSRQINGY